MNAENKPKEAARQGIIVGGVAGEAVASSLDEELEEFTHWDIFLLNRN
ncbi:MULTISPECIES: hypothetical protein [unclassified Pseudomonas]|nr:MULTISPECIES: hypothetical protein [unclassified Pseudomonas]UVM53388.1 hypothetical protein LOY38_25790 [Pseudomonas sp. B21-015]WPN60843.1 hypothetical protein QMK51_24665 [Pseudomonas sp. P9_31]